MIIYVYTEMDLIFVGGVPDPLISLQTELSKYRKFLLETLLKVQADLFYNSA